MHVVLVQPEIPPNTGNVGRLCAATNQSLHLVHPLGFSLDDRYLKRAGLDYWPWLDLHQHADWAAFRQALPEAAHYLLFSKKADRPFWEAPYSSDSVLIFGRETVGLNKAVLDEFADRCWRIPMANPNVRSLNLSTAVGVVLYEGLRRLGGR